MDLSFDHKVTHLLSRHGEGGVEPLLKRAAALEDGGQEEVEQGPQLGQLVLQRSASEQHPPRGQVVSVQDLRQLTVVVLHTVALVHDHVLPAKLWRGKTEARGEARLRYILRIHEIIRINGALARLLTLASTCLSLMMYSYVVSSTLNLPLRRMGTNARRAAGEPYEIHQNESFTIKCANQLDHATSLLCNDDQHSPCKTLSRQRAPIYQTHTPSLIKFCKYKTICNYLDFSYFHSQMNCKCFF